MEVIFFNAADQVLFTREDMEQGHWVQQEMSVNATFPYSAGKVITRGMRIGFRDPATDALEVFEIRTVQNVEPDHYQQITAEHIAVAELSDEHIDSQEITGKTPAQVLTTALSGTTWSVGNVGPTNSSSCDIQRGSVWQALQTIQSNWNVYCVPRVTVTAAGITGKYIDIISADGVFRGVRLSFRKNMADSTVIYDDTEVLTALYGYGGSVDVPQAQGDDQTQELTFAGVTWTATAEHPAKPHGQTYLEWPQKTALYGRNGRPRFGYYQNGDIKDAGILLQKTWEALQKTSDPKISISGTCTELTRLGYTDTPMRLHDIAIVEIEETGELFHKQIIALDVDLIDPTATVPEIGDYIPNIIYINRDTENHATGGGGGGGGRRGQTKQELEDSRYFAQFEKTDRLIGMVVGMKNGDYYIKSGEIALAINDADESEAWINADHVNISATQNTHMLAGDLFYDAQGRLVISNAGGVYTKRTESGVDAYFGVWDEGNLTGGVMVQKINGETTTKIHGNRVLLQSTEGATVTLDDKATVLGMLQIQGGALYVGGAIHAQSGTTATQIFGKHVVSGSSVLQVAGAQSGSIDVTAAVMRNVIKEITLTDNGNNTYTMTWTNINGTTTTKNFSKSTTVTVSGFSVTGITSTGATMFNIEIRVDLSDGTHGTITVPVNTSWDVVYKKIGEVSGDLVLSSGGWAADRTLTISAPQVSSVTEQSANTSVKVTYNRVTTGYNSSEIWSI